MNIEKFLLIDLIIFFTIYALRQGIRKFADRDQLDEPLDHDKNSSNQPIPMPDLKQLLEKENYVRKNGSGIMLQKLIGTWTFETVWKNKENKQDNLTSSFLRIFSANLKIDVLDKDSLDENVPNKDCTLCITNSIQFGILGIKFFGFGYLQGSQPILYFFFERIELLVAEKPFLTRSLKGPSKNNWPFFALIGIGPDCSWLSARGRGGGLALWKNLN
ncbi:hypothetical protein [Prochlorococcus sp. MIT 1300]|uniref:hypothetical protein n=1 Tax=Prochlorococcus sp. MIT 1300 TaxID=3096218 RepID=UPI002A7583A2|nr:hypothetical protein [Prochlorococcus sp. MIT 1300]